MAKQAKRHQQPSDDDLQQYRKAALLGATAVIEFLAAANNAVTAKQAQGAKFRQIVARVGGSAMSNYVRLRAILVSERQLALYESRQAAMAAGEPKELGAGV